MVRGFIIKNIVIPINKTISRFCYFGSVLLNKIKDMENGERKEIIIVSLTIYILILEFTQRFVSTSIDISGNKTIDGIQVPYSVNQISTLTAILYGIGIIYLIFIYICTLFYPVTEKNDPEKENQYQQKINLFLISNLILTAISIFLLILHSILINCHIILVLIIFVAFANFVTPIGLFFMRIKPVIVTEPENAEEIEIDKKLKLDKLLKEAKKRRENL